MNKANNLKFVEIEVGRKFSFSRVVDETDGKNFAELSGDFNPLHTDDTFAQGTAFGKRVVYGMLASSLFSRLVGMECPGQNCLYLSQTLNFKNPIFYGQTLEVVGTVTAKSESIQTLTIKTEIFVNSQIAIDGIAKVKVLQ